MLLSGQAWRVALGGCLDPVGHRVLAKMLLTWRSTVLGLMNSAWAIARLLGPAAINHKTSTSRPVRPGPLVLAP